MHRLLAGLRDAWTFVCSVSFCLAFPGASHTLNYESAIRYEKRVKLLKIYIEKPY